MSEKIKPHHLERKAILYVRQSSAYQVAHNLESQKLQYAMENHLHQLGWREVEVVDDDLGRSAAGTVARVGFERMVAEVCLGKVGAVAAREVSRFARNSREWQQLIEVCRIVDTILIDQETVYAPRQSNDRLLLGLKGSLNEYELDKYDDLNYEENETDDEVDEYENESNINEEYDVLDENEEELEDHDELGENEEVLVDEFLKSEKMPHVDGEFALYFSNITETLMFY